MAPRPRSKERILAQPQPPHIRSLHPGEVIYSEGYIGKLSMYVIKEGKVEISTVRGDKKVILDTLGKGQFFGESALVSQAPRSHTARAVTFCELQVLEGDTLDNAFAGAPPLLRHMLRTLIVQAKEKEELLASSAELLVPPNIVAYAHILSMMAPPQDTNPMRGGGRRMGGMDTRKEETSVPVMEVVKKCRAIIGHSRSQVVETLKRMAMLNLLAFDAAPSTRSRNAMDFGVQTPSKPSDGVSSNQNIRFDETQIVDRAQQVSTQDTGTGYRSELELICVNDLEKLVTVDRKLLLKKLAQGEIADELFAFRKSEVLRFIEEKGRNYFARRAARSANELESLEDLEYVDQRTLFEALAGVDVYDLAKLLSGCQDEAIRDKVLACMSRIRRQELEDLTRDGLRVDSIEVQQIEESLMATIRQMKRPAAPGGDSAGAAGY